MSQVFDISSTYKDWIELVLAALCLLSFLCAARLTYILRRSRRATRSHATFARAMDISLDNLLYNSADYALSQFVMFMSISDMIRALFLFLRHFRLALNVYHICDLGDFSGTFCLAEDFILWVLISNDIICYGVICFCLFRYLRKRSIFTAHSITPTRINCAIISLSVVQAGIQLFLVLLFSDFTFEFEVIYIPSLIILYSTVLYILSIFAYIRCCHPFWVLGKTTEHRQYIFLVVFTVIFIIPITMKMVLALLEPEHSSRGKLSLVADILLTQTGTGNFLAWYFSQRGQLAYIESKETRMFKDGSEESSVMEMGSRSEDIVDVLKHKHRKGNNEKRLKMFSAQTFSALSPSQTRSTNTAYYKPPSMDVNDVLAMEPMTILSTTSDYPLPRISASDLDVNRHRSTNLIYVDSSHSPNTKPDNMEVHIHNEYGVKVKD
eukprot:1110880_1